MPRSARDVTDVAGWGYAFKKKKNESGRVPKQTCSQSTVRGVSTHYAEEKAHISAHDGH